jgi:hypothetical protein
MCRGCSIETGDRSAQLLWLICGSVKGPRLVPSMQLRHWRTMTMDMLEISKVLKPSALRKLAKDNLSSLFDSHTCVATIAHPRPRSALRVGYVSGQYSGWAGRRMCLNAYAVTIARARFFD